MERALLLANCAGALASTTGSDPASCPPRAEIEAAADALSPVGRTEQWIRALIAPTARWPAFSTVWALGGEAVGRERRGQPQASARAVLALLASPPSRRG